MATDPVPGSAHPGAEANAGVGQRSSGDPPGQFPDFSELQTSWDPNVPTKPTLSWFQPDNAGPWRAPIRRGEVLSSEMLVNAPRATTGG